MPKDVSSKKKPSRKAAATTTPGVQPAAKRGGMLPAPPAAPPAAVKPKPKAKPKPKRATVVKAVKEVPVPVAEVDDDGSPPGSQDEYEDFPDDGMDDVLADDEDEPPAAGLLEFITELDQLEGDNDDEELQAAAEFDSQPEDTVTAKDATRARQKRGQDGLQLFASTATSLRTPSSLRTLSSLRTPSRPVVVRRGSSMSPEPGLYTPYAARVNPKDHSKPLVSLQSPHTRTLLKRIAQQLHSKAVTENAFPDAEALLTGIGEGMISLANELGLASRGLRYQGDPVYEDVINRLFKRAIISLRSAMITTGRDLAGPGYGLGAGRGSPVQNKAYVTMLAMRGNYVYRELETEENTDGTYRVTKRSGPYRHPNIATIILQEFFTSHEQMAVAGATKSLFNPIPLAAIAFAATVMQCALRDWQTGVRVKSSSDFSADEWTAHYKAHMRELERMRDMKPREVDGWLRKLWRDCWTTTSQYLASQGDEEESFIAADELDDFADIELDA